MVVQWWVGVVVQYGVTVVGRSGGTVRWYSTVGRSGSMVRLYGTEWRGGVVVR